MAILTMLFNRSRLKGMLFILLAIGLFWACHSDKKSLLTLIELEEQLIDSGEPVTDDELVHLSDLYRLFLDKWPEDHERYCRFSYRKAGVMVRLNYHDSAKSLLYESIHQCAGLREVHPFALDLLAAIYETEPAFAPMAGFIRRGIADRYPVFYTESGTRATPGGDISLYGVWYDVEAHFDSLDAPPPASAVLRHVYTARALSLVYPGDSESVPAMMYKAAGYAYSIGRVDLAVEMLEWVRFRHPKAESGPGVLVLLGFLYENEKRDLDRAHLVYSQFLESYPGHPMAEQVEASIEHLGKSPDELIEMFRARNEEQHQDN